MRDHKLLPQSPCPSRALLFRLLHFVKKEEQTTISGNITNDFLVAANLHK